MGASDGVDDVPKPPNAGAGCLVPSDGVAAVVVLAGLAPNPPSPVDGLGASDGVAAVVGLAGLDPNPLLKAGAAVAPEVAPAGLTPSDD